MRADVAGEHVRPVAWAWTDGRVALAAFFAALLAYLSNASVLPINPDTVPNAFLSASLLGDGDFAFTPSEAPLMFTWGAQSPEGSVEIHVRRWGDIAPGSSMTFAQHYKDGRLKYEGYRYYLVPTRQLRPGTGEPLFVGTFGPAAGLTALPFLALAHVAGVRLWEDEAAVWGLAKLTAASLIAASVAFTYLVAVGFASRGRALLLTAGYALGTCVWATSSQSLWQQTPEIFFLSLGAACLLRIREPWLRGAAAGLALCAAASCRPTAALVVLVVAAWLLFSERRAFAAFVVAALPLAIAVFLFNTYYFGTPFDSGQLTVGRPVALYKTGSPELWQTPLWLGAAGLLVSPSRGLLVFSPFLAAAFMGAVLVWKDERYRSLRFLTLAVPALWVPAFMWFDWWGGWAYGYRPIVDSVPLLVLLCLPALDWSLARPAWRTVFIASLAWSIFVQALGAFAYSPGGWNSKDADGHAGDVDRPAHRGRLWSIRDSQIGYLVANFRQARQERNDHIIW